MLDCVFDSDSDPGGGGGCDTNSVRVDSDTTLLISLINICLTSFIQEHMHFKCDCDLVETAQRSVYLSRANVITNMV